ncbi:NIPSNAP family protein [uncultured Gimesia sp.]|uniref:NIPSNAP family protein n=1 Tax=uncultured Gimesia sp. TaxID=1678688 RepID=UPI0030DC8E15|tara:strand:+ start:37691 stop:38488 length:798 start_codon:yes stop_codon:yes gene_type:complete
MTQNTTDRRQFLAGSVGAAVALGLGQTAHSAAPQQKQEFFELRTYRIADAAKQKLVSDYLANALLPALKRQGIDRVGVFKEMDGKDDHSLYVLIPFKSLDQFSAVNDVLEKDAAYHKAAETFFALPNKSAAYSRIESRLMKAFSGMPVLEVPEGEGPHLFELRTYESSNANLARLKVDMFNSGEIDIMKNVKLSPVFFGEMLIGDDVPNLTYMLSGPNRKAHDEHWKGFINHPEWDRMKKMDKYKGTVSKITKWYLEPLSFSEIQ